MAWLGFGYLFDLRSVFSNYWMRRISVGEGFAYSGIWKCVKDASALCQERKLLSYDEFSILLRIAYVAQSLVKKLYPDQIVFDLTNAKCLCL